MLPAYAELHCRSSFTFLTGASHPGELVQRAQQLGYAALAITDECSLAGVVRAHVAAIDCKLPLIVGAEMRLAWPGAALRLVLLAQTRAGYGRLSHWITLARRRAAKGSYLAHVSDLEGAAPGAPFLAGLPECLALLVPDADHPAETVLAQAQWLKAWFGARAFIAIELLLRAGDDTLRSTVEEVARHTALPIVAAGDVLMHLRSRKPLQDTLTATRLKRPVAECGLQLEPNAEAHLRDRSRLGRLYEPEWLANTLRVAGACRFSLAELRYEYPQEIVPAGETPASHLRKLVAAGLPGRFPRGKFSDAQIETHERQIERELALIRQLEYEAYFLTVADIVRWARAQNILCQGRGSAANSLVCYCLGITEVNPEDARLLFERFISAERKEPPDIDVDFEHQRREEVIQYIYDKYGRHRAALTAVVISYRPRSAVRDVGRALGIDEQQIDAVAKSQQWWDVLDSRTHEVSPPRMREEADTGLRGGIAAQRLRENGFDPASPVVRLWMELTRQLIGFPRHLSQHPGGFVIARDRIEELVPVENAAMPERSVVQWDKDDLDTLGLIKVDILALGMLSALQRALHLIGRKRGHPFLMQDVQAGDGPTYEMICRADTVGVFQIESRAQMSMLPRLQPRCYYDLVVEVAIVRPGPIKGGMVHPYLKNRLKKDEEIDYPLALRPALERTKGVPIFQEQVMQIAMIAADFTPGEADQLRRAMAAWKRQGGLGHFRERLIERMVAKHYDRDFAERIFSQIEGFGEYGFPESHAAGFAQLAYVSSWIKRHHPDVFLCALLNSQPMGFYQPAQLVRDARAHGVKVLPVDVNVSGRESALEALAPTASGDERYPVRLGLNQIAGLGTDAGRRIEEVRGAHPFMNVEDLTRRARLDAHELHLLAQSDALQSLAGHRHQAGWAAAGIDTRPTELLRATRVHEAPARLAAPTDAQDMLADYRTLGLSLKRHPLALLRDELAAFRVQPAAVLNGYPDGRLARASGLVTHRQRPGTANGTVFVTLEDETGVVNVIVWPRVAEAQRLALLGSTLMTVYGTWQREGEGAHAVMHLVAARMVDHSALLQGLASRSRNFR